MSKRLRIRPLRSVDLFMALRVQWHLDTKCRAVLPTSLFSWGDTRKFPRLVSVEVGWYRISEWIPVFFLLVEGQASHAIKAGYRWRLTVDRNVVDLIPNLTQTESLQHDQHSLDMVCHRNFYPRVGLLLWWLRVGRLAPRSSECWPYSWKRAWKVVAQLWLLTCDTWLPHGQAAPTDPKVPLLRNRSTGQNQFVLSLCVVFLLFRFPILT